MTIKSKNWIVRDDRTPDVNTLTVAGLVPTTASNAFPLLTLSSRQSEAGQLNLDLTYKAGDFGLQILSEAPVIYTQPSDTTITTVCIYQDEELLENIDELTVIQ
ncbi:hypothetical protein [Pseudomonas sp. RGM 3321]|uniref:hypothetical protein n=1 Tax=Pseudomonas sp. RGM 3321 TaxID=2930089 RepID=UPI001FCC0BF7|nr:hypothetical protein [Pseudomonas sp. RGM 3321]MCJ2374101.1 hypothetical protein [Pseudomonas sp. RGM 3321]